MVRVLLGEGSDSFAKYTRNLGLALITEDARVSYCPNPRCDRAVSYVKGEMSHVVSFFVDTWGARIALDRVLFFPVPSAPASYRHAAARDVRCVCGEVFCFLCKEAPHGPSSNVCHPMCAVLCST